MAEWSALQSGKRGDSSSIPAKIKIFFSGESSLEKYIASRFESIFNFKSNKLFFVPW